MSEWIIAATVLVVVISAFIGGWWIGGNSREKSIVLKLSEKSLKDYGEMLKKQNQVNDLVDTAKSLLSDRLRSPSNLDTQVRTAKKTGGGKKT